MILCRIVFVLYFLKLTGASGFWKKVQETDNLTRNMAIICQKLLLKVEKSKIDLKFLYKCKKENVYRICTMATYQKQTITIRKQLYQKKLQNTVEDNYSWIKELQSDLQKALSILDESTTWVESSLIKFLIKRLLSNKTRQKVQQLDYGKANPGRYS